MDVQQLPLRDHWSSAHQPDAIKINVAKRKLHVGAQVISAMHWQPIVWIVKQAEMGGSGLAKMRLKLLEGDGLL